MRQLRDELCSCRRNDDLIRPARELDVSHRCLGGFIPQVGAHGLARHRLERERSDELLRTARHHDLHIRATLDEASYEIRALVSRDAAGDAEEDFAG